MESSIMARLAAYEVLAAGALTFVLAAGGPDPDLSKAKAVLDVLLMQADQGLAHLPEEAQREARSILASVVDQVMKNLPALRDIAPGRH